MKEILVIGAGLMISEENLMEAISAVEHPEINCTLASLGIVRDVALVPDTDSFVFTLVVPTFGIPEQIRDAMIRRVYEAGCSIGADLHGVYVVEMDETERNRFFSMAQQNWKLDGEAPCGKPEEI